MTLASETETLKPVSNHGEFRGQYTLFCLTSFPEIDKHSHYLFFCQIVARFNTLTLLRCVIGSPIDALGRVKNSSERVLHSGLTYRSVENFSPGSATPWPLRPAAGSRALADTVSCCYRCCRCTKTLSTYAKLCQSLAASLRQPQWLAFGNMDILTNEESKNTKPWRQNPEAKYRYGI